MGDAAEDVLEELRALRADLAEREAAAKAREEELRAELARLRAVTDELVRRRGRRADPPQGTTDPEIRKKVYDAVARRDARRGRK